MAKYAPKPQRHWLLRFSTPREITYRLVFLICSLAMFALGLNCFLNAITWFDKPFAGFLVNRRMIVSSNGMPEWSGIKAGLLPADRVTRIGDREVTQTTDLENAVRSSEIGSLLDYTVERSGKYMTFSVQVMRFTLSDFIGTFGSTFLQGIIFFSIGIIVFILKPDSTISLLFYVASTIQGASTVIDFAVASSPSVFFSYLMIACSAAITAPIVHFSALFPFHYNFVNRHPRLLLIPYFISAFLVLLLLMLYPGPLFSRFYSPVTAGYLFLAILCFIGTNLYTYFRSVSSLAKQRARVIFWGALFAFPLPILAALIANTGVLTFDIPILTNLTALPIIIFPVAIAYSITRHNLFDVDIYIKRAVGYGLMTGVLGASYFGVQLLLKAVVLSDTAEKLSPAIFALLVVIFFNPVNRRIQGMIDRLFFRQKFDYKQAVITISDALSSVLELKEIVGQINGAIRKEMFIDNAGVIVLDPLQNVHHGYFTRDQGKEEAKEDQINIAGNKALDLVIQQRKMVTRYDVAENPRYSVGKDILLERFNELGSTMLIPMVYQDRVNAIITVGHKKSGQFYSKEDVELLTTLASHGAVSIENAHLAEKMKHEETVRTNLARYLSPQVVEGIVKSDMQVNLGGDRKVVTVLFSDIRNFTRITENQPADKLVRMLNEYFTAMAECIFAHQGSLDKYIGDAIVAVFGSLIPLDQPDEHAVQAAVSMMRRLEELNQSWEKRGYFSMHMGIGICSGEVFLGNIGSVERMEFTVIGDTVNMASRLSGVAKAEQIIVSESSRNNLSSSIPIRELPPVQVKGKEGEHKVFEIAYS